MCSVRQSPMPSAPNSRAFNESSGRSALARTFIVRTSSAQPSTMPNGPVGSGVTTGTSPTTTSPVPPLIEITSPSRTVIATALPALSSSRERTTVNCFFARSICSASAPQIAGLPIPRATTAAWLTSPPRDVRMPSAAIMPCRSSGDVSGRTRITASPAAADASASSAVNDTLPTAAPGDAFEAGRQHVVLRGRVELRVQELVELRGLDPEDRLALVDQALALHLDRHPQRGHRGALADPGLQEEEAALLDRELDVAHVVVVLLEQRHHVEQLPVALREVVAPSRRAAR